MTPLKQSFFSRAPRAVARNLLGKILVHRTRRGLISGMIVETESYGGSDDPASHAYKKITQRNFVMFGPPGYSYVYLCYGMYELFNVSTEKQGIPAAVLVRALEPLDGIELMKRNRGVKNIRSLTSGPGKLTQALGITRRQNNRALFRGDLFIVPGRRKVAIARSRRIGLSRGADKLLRFFIKGNPYVSAQ